MRTLFWTYIAIARGFYICTRQTSAGERRVDFSTRAPSYSALVPSTPPLAFVPSRKICHFTSAAAAAALTAPLCPLTLDRPAAADLAAAIGAESVLLARDAGGDSFDDASLHPYTDMRTRFEDAPFTEVRL